MKKGMNVRNPLGVFQQHPSMTKNLPLIIAPSGNDQFPFTKQETKRLKKEVKR